MRVTTSSARGQIYMQRGNLCWKYHQASCVLQGPTRWRQLNSKRLQKTSFMWMSALLILQTVRLLIITWLIKKFIKMISHAMISVWILGYFEELLQITQKVLMESNNPYGWSGKRIYLFSQLNTVENFATGTIVIWFFRWHTSCPCRFGIQRLPGIGISTSWIENQTLLCLQL